MADYSTTSTNAQTALNDAADGGFVEEYRVGRQSVRRGKILDQIRGAAMLEGLAARRTNGLFRVAKMRSARP